MPYVHKNIFSTECLLNEKSRENNKLKKEVETLNQQTYVKTEHEECSEKILLKEKQELLNELKEVKSENELLDDQLVKSTNQVSCVCMMIFNSTDKK